MILILQSMAAQARLTQEPDILDNLLKRVAVKDQEALSDLYSRTRAAVYGFSLSYLKNGHDAEDITQDTFVQIWNCAFRYVPQGKPMAWILTIARNLSLEKLRKQSRIQELSDSQWETFAVENPAFTTEDRMVLHAALYSLSEEEQRIVLLHATTGLKHREISHILDLALPTVLSKYHRALKKLKRILEGDEAL